MEYPCGGDASDYGCLCRLYENGHTADSPEVRDLVQKLQAHITAHYYLCTDQILAGLGQMYVADDRFRNNIDRHAEDTAAFICEAIGCHLHT